MINKNRLEKLKQRLIRVRERNRFELLRKRVIEFKKKRLGSLKRKLIEIKKRNKRFLAGLRKKLVNFGKRLFVREQGDFIASEESPMFLTRIKRWKNPVIVASVVFGIIMTIAFIIGTKMRFNLVKKVFKKKKKRKGFFKK